MEVIIVNKPIYKLSDVALGFQEVIDSDFNPDIVHVFGIEMWDAGYKHGKLIGVTGSLMVFGSICGIYIVYKNIKQKFLKNEES